jgi:hypothetical protein
MASKEYRRKVAWIVEQIHRLCPYLDLPVQWFRTYSHVVEALTIGIGFPSNCFTPPEPDEKSARSKTG